jgi:hypothetical protein
MGINKKAPPFQAGLGDLGLLIWIAGENQDND